MLKVKGITRPWLQNYSECSLLPPVVDQGHSQCFESGDTIIIIDHLLYVVEGIDSVSKPDIHRSEDVEPITVELRTLAQHSL